MIDFRLYYRSTPNFRLIGHTDPDWLGDIDYKKSTSGYIFNMGSTAIAWSSKK